jgi:uncharacterized membrane protein (DUF106 family)
MINLTTVDLGSLLLVLSIFAIIGGFLVWILGKFLTDKKDKMTLAFEIEKIKTAILELKEDTKAIEEISRQLNIVEERIKHL